MFLFDTWIELTLALAFVFIMNRWLSKSLERKQVSQKKSFESNNSKKDIPNKSGMKNY